jgi:hypothetical protein
MYDSHPSGMSDTSTKKIEDKKQEKIAKKVDLDTK